ncbi:heavy metal transporter [Halobacteriales archaeon SW_7_68_16]|nr:MAG: heavy metal transporter [Halobacteriales archaeon SW_7_68_16]
MDTMELMVRGMTCQGCEEVVEEAVRMADDVDDVDADRYESLVEVHGAVDRDVVAEKVRMAGYGVES